MFHKCFVTDCGQEADGYCDCEVNLTYFCDEHTKNHFVSEGSHLPEYSELLAKAKRFLQDLEKIEGDIRTYTDKSVANVLEASKKALQDIREKEKYVKRLIVDILAKDKKREVYEKIAKFSIPSIGPCFPNCSMITEKLPHVFNIKSVEENNYIECDRIVFSKDNERGGLWSIDLTTLKLNKLDFASIGKFGGACIIQKEVYFFYGGCKNGFVGDAYLVNMIEKTVKSLQSSIARAQFASVFKDNKVFVFGGYLGKGKLTDSSQIYDFALNQWTDISSLPSCCHHTTASVRNNEIIITGMLFDKVYEYNGLTYSPILKVKSDENKVVCDGWIVTPSILFEYELGKNSTWKAHAILINLGLLHVYATFKRSNYIYFIDFKNILWRVNTARKVVEQVKYSG